MITYNNSIALTQKLRTLCPRIHGVELFGSVLTNGQGRDADFLILVDDMLAKHWWQTERESIRVRWPDWLYQKRWVIKKFAHFLYVAGSHKRRRQRLGIAAKILDLPLEQLADSNGQIPDFEMFLVPTNWRTNKEVNLDAMSQITDLVQHQNTIGFLRRIAKDAMKIA